MEQQNNEPIDALEEEPPLTEFKTKIEGIYHDLPQSIKIEYQESLKNTAEKMILKLKPLITYYRD